MGKCKRQTANERFLIGLLSRTSGLILRALVLHIEQIAQTEGKLG